MPEFLQELSFSPELLLVLFSLYNDLHLVLYFLVIKNLYNMFKGNLAGQRESQLTQDAYL